MKPWKEALSDMVERFSSFIHKREEPHRNPINIDATYDNFVAEFANAFYHEHLELFETDRAKYFNELTRAQEREWHKVRYRIK